MTLDYLFKRELRKATKSGANHTWVQYLCGCTERKIVLTQAEVQSAKQCWTTFMQDKLWNDPAFGQGWLFGSPDTMLNIGLVPSKLAHQRLRLNSHNWKSGSYIQVT